MLGLQGQGTLYFVLDALDECPEYSGSRGEDLEIVKELIDLKFPHLHLCVTSRPEIDIGRVLEPLNPHNVALHDQKGQKPDVGQYLESVVHTDRTIRNWPRAENFGHRYSR